MAITLAEIRVRFPLPEGADQAATTEAEVTVMAHAMATRLLALVPGSREQTLAITALEQVVAWAHAGITRAPARAAHSTPERPRLVEGGAP